MGAGIDGSSGNNVGSRSAACDDGGSSRSSSRQQQLYVMCRRGNNSQLAVEQLKAALGLRQGIVDIVGGIENWAREVQPGMPII